MLNFAGKAGMDQENFETLAVIGEAYSAKEGYALFGRYCLHKEAGLNKAAISAIREFVVHARGKPVSTQREIALELVQLGYSNQRAHQLLPHPLRECLKEVFQQWSEDEPESAIPLKWLGYASRDVLFYHKALAIDPDDPVCIIEVATSCLNYVYYQTHHLSESFFIGDPDESRKTLAKVDEWLARLPPSPKKEALQSEVAYFNHLVGCWEEYTGQDAKEAFPEWCADREKDIRFSSVYYYKK